MKCRSIVFVLFSVSLLIAESNAEPQWVPGQIIIKLKEHAGGLRRQGTAFQMPSLDELGTNNRLLGYRRIVPKEDPRLPNISRMFVLRFPKEADVPDLCRRYRSDPNVEGAEPNYIGGQCGSVPDDQYWPLQWGLFPDRLNLPGAWDLVYQINPPPKNGNEMIVAVIDNGIDTLHPDLRHQLWLNADEIPDDGFDDDGNGYVDDTRGWNFIADEYNNNVFPQEEDGTHGTQCAGIIAAATCNGRGIAGIAGGWGSMIGAARIMPLRIYGPGHVQVAEFVEAIAYAVTNGAKVISMSIHLPSDSRVQDAIDDAYNNGCVLVAASGNGRTAVECPANCEHVIAVGATLPADTAWYASNYGAELDVMAPGGEDYQNGYPDGTVYTTTLRSDGSYGYFSGTSAACPHVAGLAALLMIAKPSLTNVQVERIMEYTADTIDHVRYPYGEDHWNDHYGYGRINAYKAVAMALGENLPPSAPTGLAVTATGMNHATLQWNANTEDDLWGYCLYYGTSPGVYGEPVDVGRNTSYTLTGLADHTPYYIALKAYDIMNQFSGFSNAVTAYPGHMRSFSQNATLYNNARRMAWSGSTLSLVYESSGRIYYTRSTDLGVTWTDEVCLDNSGQASCPAIACDKNHRRVVVWQRSGEDGWHIRRTQSNDGVNWSGGELAGSPYEPRPSIGMRSDNTWVACWKGDTYYAYSTGRPKIYAHAENGGADIYVDSVYTGGQCGCPTMGIAGMDAYASWAKQDATTGNISKIVYKKIGAVNGPVMLSSDLAVACQHPSLADGDPLFVSWLAGGASPGVYLRSIKESGYSSQSYSILQAAGVSYPSVVNNGGEPYVVWPDASTGHDYVYVFSNNAIRQLSHTLDFSRNVSTAVSGEVCDPVSQRSVRYIGTICNGVQVLPNVVEKFDVTNVINPDKSDAISTLDNNPKQFLLHQNSPNPTSGNTRFRYQLSMAGRTTLKVYNTFGQLVKTVIDQAQTPGSYMVEWGGKDNRNRLVADGVYFYRLESGNYRDMKKLVMIR